MASVKDGEATEGRDYAAPGDAVRVRELLAQMGMSQRAAARELEISERMMRYYCGGQRGDKVPRVVMLALERLKDMQRKVAAKT